MKNRMRESRSFGSVRGEGREVLAYSESLSCTSMHFQALSCNGRLPKGRKIRYLASTDGAHNARVEGSSPSLSINRIRVIVVAFEIGRLAVSVW